LSASGQEAAGAGRAAFRAYLSTSARWARRYRSPVSSALLDKNFGEGLFL
jgi:hypothetical protein